jgi:hypothetical protein
MQFNVEATGVRKIFWDKLGAGFAGELAQMPEVTSDATNNNNNNNNNNTNPNNSDGISMGPLMFPWKSYVLNSMGP